MSNLTDLEIFNVIKDCFNILLQTVVIILQLAGIIYVVRTLRYTADQIKHAEKVHADTLKWNKKMATESILEIKPDRNVTKNLDDTFNTIDSHKPIRNILKLVKNNKALEFDIHHLLNVYERLARGIENDIYVEEMVKTALKTTFIKVYNNYSIYINYRQDNMNPEAWVYFEKYAQKWDKVRDK